MRRYERDADAAGWHDGLLMGLLDADLDQRVHDALSDLGRLEVGGVFGGQVGHDGFDDRLITCVTRLRSRPSDG